MSTTFAEKKAEATAAVEAMHQKLATQIESGADWMAHLRFMSKMRSYSPRNTLLMWWQWEERQMGVEISRLIESAFLGAPVSEPLPNFTVAAAFSKWSELGGSVRKGEKALSVLAPVVVTDKENIDPATGKPAKKLIGFVLKNRTFEISQTEGVEIPDDHVKLLEGDGPDGAWDALVKVAEAIGFSVNIEPITGGPNGFTRWGDQHIGIKQGNPKAQQVKTLAHEIGHALLHGPNLPVGMPTKVQEVEAESVAYTVMASFGMESDDYSLGYVGGWSKGDGALIASTIERVSNAAARIITFIETGELPGAKASAKYDFSDDTEIAA